MIHSKFQDGSALFNVGRYDEAIPLLLLAAENEGTPEQWNDLGACQFKANLPQAENSLRRALLLDPHYTLAKLNLGVLLVKNEHFAEAVPLLESARESLDPADQPAIDELLRICATALAPVMNRPPRVGAERPRILFLAADFGLNGLSEANASEARLLYAALHRSRPAWDVRFASVEREATRRAVDADGFTDLLPVHETAQYVKELAPDLVHIVAPSLKFPPESLLETHAVVMTVAGSDPTQHCSQRDLEEARHLIDFARLAIVCEAESAQEILERAGIKARAMIPPIVSETAAVVPLRKPRKEIVCGFATSPFLPEYWEPRGIPLLLELAALSPETNFLLAWRTDPEEIEREIAARRLENVFVRAGRLDMDLFYADVDFMILPFARALWNHVSPLSAVEGLLRGKPVLATEYAGIADWIRREGAGIITEASAAALRSGLLKLSGHLKVYGRQALVSSRRRFNSEANAAAYVPIYAEMLQAAKGPTLADWEADVWRTGRELVRGRTALAAYYAQSHVANRYVADRFVAPPFDQLNAQELQAIPKLVRAKFEGRTDLKLLDFASGTGRLTGALEPFGTVVAFDGSAAMLGASYLHTSSGIRAMVGDVFQTPLGDRFHVVACGRFLRHFEYPDRREIYRRLHEALRDDGIAIVDLPDPEFEEGFRDKSNWGKFNIYDVFWTLPSFREELRHNGFQLASFEPVGANIQLYEGQPHLEEYCYYLVSFEKSPAR